MQVVADSRKWMDGKETTQWYIENCTLQKGEHYSLTGCVVWHQGKKIKARNPNFIARNLAWMDFLKLIRDQNKVFIWDSVILN